MITKLRRRLGGEEGFTLVELMLVIVVLGVLAGVAVPRLTGVGDQAERSALEANARTVQNSIDMYHTMTGNWPGEEENKPTFGDLDDDMGIEMPSGLNFVYGNADDEDYVFTIEEGGEYIAITGEHGIVKEWDDDSEWESSWEPTDTD
ncbi:type II secretion system GspH family protein [Natroniella sulfidigena]|uniref:type II secretion system protein n=1 Tax=Natroniella sulfidigena TaxID=723921 RepID=UPI00200B4EF1|nr:prepilin-type N-terminal cleavage/methylation domain-containing protein [Natroniella sulfidigena]MCK8816853.1 type II secretion system GspH family protein [Natroniella sulfidigena]